MSQISISYNSLRDASDDAKKTAKRIEDYADTLDEKVLKKINNYDGDWNSNIRNSKTYTTKKINQLNNTKERYYAYSRELNGLVRVCNDTDTAVKRKVNSLTTDFKKANGIRNHKVINAIGYLINRKIDSTRAGRWIKDKYDLSKTGRDYIKSAIKEWYNYSGGKEYIKGIIINAGKMMVALSAICIAILSGGSLLVMIAGVIGGALALIDSAFDSMNEVVALLYAKDDPALARRHSSINGFNDYITSSFKYDDSGDKYKYNKNYERAGMIFDGVHFVCTAITLVSSVGKLMKNGYKCITKTSDDVSFRTMFSHEGKAKLSAGFKRGMTDIKCVIHRKDITEFRHITRENFRFFIKDMFKNMDKSFMNYDKELDGLKSFKNTGSVIQAFGEKGIGGAAKTIILRSVSVGDIPGANGSYIELGDVIGTPRNIWKSIGSFLSLDKNVVPTINIPVLEKMSMPSSVNVGFVY